MPKITIFPNSTTHGWFSPFSHELPQLFTTARRNIVYIADMLHKFKKPTGPWEARKRRK
jgi:hypothetical protein